MTYAFRVDDPPVPVNRMYRYVDGKTLLSEDARSFKAAVGWAATAAGIPMAPKGQQVDVTIWYYHAHPRARIDTDNLPKVILDGGERIIYQNDRQVRDLTIRPRWNQTDPHLWIEVDWLATDEG